MDQHEIDLYVLDAELDMEALPEANALSTIGTVSTVGSATASAGTVGTLSSSSLG